MSDTDEARVRCYADAARPYFGDAAARAVIAVADEEQAARWEELKELAQQVADTRRRAETAEAEVERLTRECLDREATETDARERLRQAEERLAAVEALAEEWSDPAGRGPVLTKRACAALIRAALAGESRV